MSASGLLGARVALVLGVTGMAAGATYLVTRDEGSAPVREVAVGGLDAWIDAPLDGALLGTGPVLVTAHAASPEGIASVDLRVTRAGADVASQSAPVGGGPLEAVTFTWPAGEPGTYRLAVQGREADGGTTPEAAVSVRVEPDGTTAATAGGTTTATRVATTMGTLVIGVVPPSSTTTAPPAVTTTVAPPGPTTATTAGPPPTGPTTSIACTVAAPALTQPAADSAVRDRTPVLAWTSGCNPVAFSVQMGREPSFRRLDIEVTTIGSARSWEVPADKALVCGATYYWRVGADGLFAPGSRFTVSCTGLL